MAAYLEGINFDGFAKWMKVQAWEELGHAMKFYDFINERGGKVVLKEIPSPKTEWGSVKEIFEEAYEHEKGVTDRIHKIYKMAEEKKDYATMVFLNWFIEEQVEEEAQTLKILEILKKVEKHVPALYHLDAKLGQRDFEKWK
jgi:ferritin